MHISKSATSTNTNLDIVSETTPGNASGQSSRDVSTDPTSKTQEPSSGSTPASNSKAITGSISGSKPDNSSGSDEHDDEDDDEHDDEHDDDDDGFDKDTTPEDVMLHMKCNDINFRYIKRLPPRDDREVTRASFKLTVPISAFHKTISEESWPTWYFY